MLLKINKELYYRQPLFLVYSCLVVGHMGSMKCGFSLRKLKQEGCLILWLSLVCFSSLSSEECRAPFFGISLNPFFYIYLSHEHLNIYH